MFLKLPKDWRIRSSHSKLHSRPIQVTFIAMILASDRIKCTTIKCFFSPCGKWFAVGGADAIVSIWDAYEYIPVRTISRLEWPVRTLSFSHNGKLLAAASEDHVIDISHVSYFIKNGERLRDGWRLYTAPRFKVSKVSRICPGFINFRDLPVYKLGCVFPMVIFSILPHWKIWPSGGRNPLYK